MPLSQKMRRRDTVVFSASLTHCPGAPHEKDPAILHRAYNDEAGVISEFNLNLLDRLNQTLDANFVREGFVHEGIYDVRAGVMESFLISTESQTVDIPALDRAFHFEPWEPVHTEYSWKFLRSDIDSLASETGFRVIETYSDAKGWFVDSLWQVRK